MTPLWTFRPSTFAARARAAHAPLTFCARVRVFTLVHGLQLYRYRLRRASSRTSAAHSRARFSTRSVAHYGADVTRGAARDGDGAEGAGERGRTDESAARDVVQRDLESVLRGSSVTSYVAVTN